MAKQVQRRWGTTGDISTRTGAAKEILVDTTTNTAVVCDGVTLGGHPLAKATELTAGLATKAAVSHTHTTADIVAVQEYVEDTVATMFSGAHVDATVVYDDITGRLTVTSTGGGGPVSEQDTYNIDDYGADPTGVADSSAALRLAIAAASANYIATGRRSGVSAGGKYLFTTPRVATHIDLNNISNISFIGRPGRRTEFVFQGDSAGGDWYLFAIRGGSSEIEFHNIVFKMGTMTNPDPAEQNHLIQIYAGSFGIRIFDCEFSGTVGDGVRVLGESTTRTRDVQIIRSRFVDCGRSGIGTQRWSSRIAILDCDLSGGTDQCLDFEPTGASRTADVGGSSTTVITDISENFVNSGIAVGEFIYHYTDERFYRVTAVTATTVTTDTATTTWAGAEYFFPSGNSGHVVIGCRFKRTDAQALLAGDVMVTLTQTYGAIFVGNTIENGTLRLSDIWNCVISKNNITTPRTDTADAGIQVLKSMEGSILEGNIVTARALNDTYAKDGIKVAAQVRGVGNALIVNNSVQMWCSGVGIRVEGADSAQITGNNLVQCIAGTIVAVAISVRTVSINLDSVQISGNTMTRLPGARLWEIGVQIAATNGSTVGAVSLGPNAYTGCQTPSTLEESTGGSFLCPPMVCGDVAGSAAAWLTPTSAVPQIQVAGFGGAGNRRYGMFWSLGSPAGVLNAEPGSICTEDVAGLGALYVKTTASSVSTGWSEIISEVPWPHEQRDIHIPSTSANSFTNLGGPSLQTSGTATNRAPSFTSFAKRQRRVGFVAASGVVGAAYVNSLSKTVSDGTQGGFLQYFAFGMNDVVADSLMLVGLRNSVAAPTAVDPSTLTNIVGIGQIAGSANLHIVYGGSAAQTAINLGANFPTNVTDDWYWLKLFAPKASANTVKYTVIRNGGTHIATGTLTGTAGVVLPSSTTGLAIVGYRSSATAGTELQLGTFDGRTY